MIVAPVGFWIASRSLSSGAHSRDPVARNDGKLIGALVSIRDVIARSEATKQSRLALLLWIASRSPQ
jgi:hypothetical protein